MEQHLNSQKHKELHDNFKEKNSQAFLRKVDTSNNFGMALNEAFISADIPLYKLKNVDIRNLFRNYSNEIIPYQTTLRKRCLDKIYDSELNRIKNFLKK